MKRGDFVRVAIQGDFEKPRPALVIQSDTFSEHGTVTVLPVTSHLVSAPLLRIEVKPDVINNLQKPSQIMIDKAMTVKKEKLGEPFGYLSDNIMLEVNRCMAMFLGIVG